jgi:hypothetical protein
MSSAVVEPKVRRNGTCFVCGKERKLPSPMQKGVPVLAYLSDPFCSSTCARKHYGTQLTKVADTTS